LGEKYRIGKALPDFGRERKAVSDRFSSCAICNILSSSNCVSMKQTPAGLPLNGVSVKESTMKVFILWLFISSFLPAQLSQDHSSLRRYEQGHLRRRWEAQQQLFPDPLYYAGHGTQ
jgi:hypothetical protein